MSKIQLVGRPNGSVLLVCSEHPEFNINLGSSASPAVAYKAANQHYYLFHMKRDGGEKSW